jgi:small GTP-binding protein
MDVNNKPTIIRQSSTLCKNTITNYDYLFKISLIGDSGIGKTSILLRFTDNVFKDDTQSTIGVDFKIVSVNLNNSFIKMQIWDTCGSERFKGLTSSFIKSCNIFLLVYDISKRKSFENLDSWIKLIYENTSPKFMCLVGNKSDIERREVSKEEALEFCEKNGFSYLETSAKTNFNIEEVFIHIAQSLYIDIQRKKNEESVREEFSMGANKDIKIDNISLNSSHINKKPCAC